MKAPLTSFQTQTATTGGVTPMPLERFKALSDQARDEALRIEMLVDDVVKAAFAASRMPRSLEYQQGVHALLMHRALGRGLRCAYAQGTARCDAWFAGVEEGKDMWRSRVQAMARTQAAG